MLVNKGLNVLLLEIGPKWDRNTIFRTEHSWPYEMPYHGLGRPGQYDGLWKVNAYTEHLYVHPRIDRYATAPGTDFHWTRIHAVGGRTNTWARVSLRMAEWDLKPKSMQDGAGEDWPISYSDLAPYYDKAEDMLGYSEPAKGWQCCPTETTMLRRLQPAAVKSSLMKGGRKIGIPVIPVRKAILLKNRDNRSACHYCGNCDYGCATGSRFSSLDAIIPQLLGRKNFTLRTQAAVHRVLLDPKTGKARGVEFIDTRNNLTYEARARVVVLGPARWSPRASCSIRNP
ncbi:MAG: GMC family oxidoreductase [Acidobacteria bacterium]|nr:GMC family oxidoreductase [Acidobacteriota bacterium]